MDHCSSSMLAFLCKNLAYNLQSINVLCILVLNISTNVFTPLYTFSTLSFQMVLVLKKEVVKTNNAAEHEDTGKFRQLLVRTLHQCSVKFPDIAKAIIPVVSLHGGEGAVGGVVLCIESDRSDAVPLLLLLPLLLRP